MTFSQSQVEGTFAVYDGEETTIRDDLSMILAFEQTGGELDGGPLRIVVTGDDSPITDGHFWSKFVRTIRIKPVVNEWSVNLLGIETMKMDRYTFESLASCEQHQTRYRYSDETGNHTYEGVPLWVLVSAVDGADTPEGHYIFNTDLSKAGYNITVTAGDGFYYTFHSSVAARNDSILVAYKHDGEVLAENEFPLKIVGPQLTGKQKVRSIVEIKIHDLKHTSYWSLALKGAKTITYDNHEFESLFMTSPHVVHYNYSRDGIDYSYEGIPLWVFIAMVDDEESGNYTLNQTLAAGGYNITVTASDEYTATFPISQVAGNDSLILAYKLNGEVLLGDSGPLQITGSGLSGKQNVKAVVKIELEGSL
jgi:DMSO/TMAO reductase YedYZ molybdopterin-dependent catalytic subunit